MRILRSLESRLPKNIFWRNLTLVAGGTAVGQALSIVASPLLSRLYGPGDFGLLSVYASLTSIVAVVSALTYQQAIPAPDDDADGANLTVISLLLVVGAAALTAVAIALFHGALERLFDLPGLAKYIVVVPLGVLGLSSYEALSQWAARKKAFGLIAKTSAQRSMLQVGVQVGGGLAKLGIAGLVVGQLLGQWGGTIQVARKSWQKDTQTFRDVTSRSLWATAKRFKRYPLFALPGAMLNALDVNAAPLLFAHFFGATITGYFALGNRLVLVPFFLIGNSAQKVFYPAAAAAKRAGRLAQETNDTFRRLLRVVLPIVCVMSACAPELFTVLMGEKWREAGVYMQWLTLRACFTMLVFPLTPLIWVLDRPGISTLFSGLQLVVRVGSVYLGSRYGDARLAVAGLGIGTGLLWLGDLVYLMAISGNRVTGAIGQLLREALIGGAIAAPIFVAKLLHATDWGVFLTAAATTVAGAAIVARRLLVHSSASETATDPPSP